MIAETSATDHHSRNILLKYPTVTFTGRPKMSKLTYLLRTWRQRGWHHHHIIKALLCVSCTLKSLYEKKFPGTTDLRQKHLFLLKQISFYAIHTMNTHTKKPSIYTERIEARMPHTSSCLEKTVVSPSPRKYVIFQMHRSFTHLLNGKGERFHSDPVQYTRKEAQNK